MYSIDILSQEPFISPDQIYTSRVYVAGLFHPSVVDCLATRLYELSCALTCADVHNVVVIRQRGWIYFQSYFLVI